MDHQRLDYMVTVVHGDSQENACCHLDMPDASDCSFSNCAGGVEMVALESQQVYESGESFLIVANTEQVEYAPPPRPPQSQPA